MSMTELTRDASCVTPRRGGGLDHLSQSSPSAGRLLISVMRRFWSGYQFVALLCALAATAAVLPARAAAATGSISANPNHLALAPGQAGSATITWSTKQTSTAQVWVSANGGAEQLFAAGKSGSKTAPWINAPSYYVFSLYEGTAHVNRLAWTSVNTQYAPAPTFGFNYWPAGFGNNCLTAANWPVLRPEVEADLDHIVSLSGGVLRIMFWPGGDKGWSLTQGGGGTFNQAYYDQLVNLPDFLSLAAARNLRVIVAFGNHFLTTGPQSGTKWWQWAYGANWNQFRADALYWMTGFVNAIEASPYRSAVICYDFQNEVSDVHTNMWNYLNHMVDNAPVPLGKRGVSILRTSVDTPILKSNLAGRRMDYVDSHCYPTGNNPDAGAIYNILRTEFPDSTPLLGEFGAEAAALADEPVQQTEVLARINAAVTNGFPYYLNWMIWDATPNPSITHGFGYEPHTAKHVLGATSELLNWIANPDMETVSNGKPANWGAGGTVPVTHVVSGSSATDASSNYRYGRVIVTGYTSGSAWTTSSMAPVSGGTWLSVNGYLRSNMANVRMGVHEYDTNGVHLVYTPGPVFTPAGWSWNNYLHRVGAWGVQLQSATRFVIVGVSGGVVSDPAYLDVDTVSAAEQRGP